MGFNVLDHFTKVSHTPSFAGFDVLDRRDFWLWMSCWFSKQEAVLDDLVNMREEMQNKQVALGKNHTIMFGVLGTGLNTRRVAHD